MTISLDEVQFLYQMFGTIKDDSTLTPWKRPLYAIGNYMVNIDIVNLNLSRVCLIPILSGLKHISDIRFNETEFGNQELTLPPLCTSQLGTILKEYLSNSYFKCSTTMINMMSITNNVTIRRMGVLLFEALIIPEVLNLTLRGIASFLTKVTFQEWKNQSDVLFPELKKNIDKVIKGYLVKQESFNDPSVQSELLPRLLCGLNVSLTREEKDLFLKGLIYKTPTGRLYIAPRYFRQLVKKDPYISSKILKEQEIHPRDFERIDLKCICYRIGILRQLTKPLITIKELFPSCKTGDDSNKLFELDENEYKIVSHVTFISKDKENNIVKIDSSKCMNNPSRNLFIHF
ncbi:predicted protein [Naegleria gruberi]|uniref:Predicted protein n=1 Tax=Naegleria gruberi TaxID=5762 RepID=D2W6B4_NAEGR|nr:uncharacterized protein NAEGRDRAFT_54947 [Naegleria gruberi]EFC35388.1 predicted protein [Naegleria gruberi]|eukprot:XP_002668132.1 predicted protein [Naegleria gruberi strain NEG-M]